MMMTTGMHLLADSSRGIYIPQHFAKSRADGWRGIDPTDEACLLEGPSTEHYWEAWDAVLFAEFVDSAGNVWRLHHDGDLWAYCHALMTKDERISLFGFDRMS